jgi:pyruvate-formate lyase
VVRAEALPYPIQRAQPPILFDAQKHPELYRDLVVRIAGYCAYFVDLSPTQQAEIIARTEERI